jgi:hypothetical protein
MSPTSGTAVKDDARLLTPQDAPALRAGEVIAGYLAEHHKAMPARRSQALEDFTHLVRSGNPLLTRALQHQTTADNAAVVPQPIEDGLVVFRDATRPLVTASNAFAGPRPLLDAVGGSMAGVKTLIRSRATQRTQAGEQTAQGNVLASRKLQVTGDTVAVASLGGTLAVSEPDIDWTDSQVIQDVVEDLAAYYGEQADAHLASAIETAATNTTPCPLTATSDVFNVALAQAATTVLGNAKRKPDAIIVAPDRWEYVLGLTDGNQAVVYADGRPLTLPLIVSPALSAGFIAVASMAFVESWEQDKGFIRVATPETLEYTVAYRGYFASNVRAEGLCALVAS